MSMHPNTNARRSSKRRRRMFVEQLEDRRLLTGNFELLKDINTEPNTWGPETNSNPANFVDVGGLT